MSPAWRRVREAMAISEKVRQAYQACLKYGDSEEVESNLENGVELKYLPWDEFDLSFTDEGRGSTKPGRPYDLGAIVNVGLMFAEHAAANGHAKVFTLADDGNGCGVVYAPSEAVAVAELDRVASLMRDSCEA